MAERYIPEHRRTQFKAKNTFKPDELRRRREEQQVEIRKAKREENLAKRRGIGTGDQRPGASLGAAPDSDDENPPTESQVCLHLSLWTTCPISTRCCSFGRAVAGHGFNCSSLRDGPCDTHPSFSFHMFLRETPSSPLWPTSNPCRHRPQHRHHKMTKKQPISRHFHHPMNPIAWNLQDAVHDMECKSLT